MELQRRICRHFHAELRTQKAIQVQAHKPPKRRQNCPYAPPPMRYGKKSDLVTHGKESPTATEKEGTYIQKVIGSFLYYARAIDMTI